MAKKKIAILGAGITGLTAAYELAKRGDNVEVYEKDNKIGGLAATYKDKDGFYYDMGPHEFCTENERLVNLLKDLLGEDLLILRKRASQYFFDKYVPYPLRPIDFFTKIPPLLAIKVFFEVISSRFKNLSSIEANYSFESWVESRFGKTLYKLYFKPYTEKVWGISPDQLDPRTASSRISFNSIFDLLFKTLKHYISKKDDFSTIHNPLKDRFYYTKKGIGKICSRLHEECLKLGVNFKFNYELKNIVKRDSKAVKIIFSNGKSISDFEYLICTIPMTMLSEALNYNHEYPLKYRSLIFGFFSFNKPRLTPYHWIYVPDSPKNKFCFQRITEFGSLNAEMAPKGKTCIAVEVPCFTEDWIWSLPDKKVIEIIVKDLEKMNLITNKDKFNATIVKQKYAYPIQVNGFLEMIKDMVYKEIKPIKNMITIGRQGLYKYCNMNECMEMAIDVTNQIKNNVKEFNYNFEFKWKGAGLEEERILKED